MTDKETNLTPEVMDAVEKQIGGAVRRLGEEGMTPLEKLQAEARDALKRMIGGTFPNTAEAMGKWTDKAIASAFAAGEKAGREAAVRYITTHCEPPNLLAELVWRAKNTDNGETTVEVKLKELKAALKADTSDLAEDKK